MARNIIIIAVVAILAFAAVLAVPRLLNGSEDSDRDEVASEDGEESSAAGDDGAGDTDVADANRDGPLAPPPSTANPQLAAQLQQAAQQINSGGPVRIDEMTTMTGATAQGNRIRYRYEVSQTLTNSQIDQFRDYAQRTNQQTLCSRTETRQLLDMGGEIEYAYYGPGDTYLFSTPIIQC